MPEIDLNKPAQYVEYEKMSEKVTRRTVLSSVGSGILVSVSGNSVGAVSPYDGVEQKWEQSMGDQGVSGPLVQKGNIFFGVDSNLLRLNGQGEQIWKTDVKSGLIEKKPVLQDDTVFIGTYTGIGAVDRGTGRVLWKTHTGHGGNTRPTLSKNFVYVTRGQSRQDGENARLFSLGKEDGNVTWSVELEDDSWSRPAIGEYVYTADTSGKLYAFEPTTGEEVWSVELGQPITSSPFIENSKVYLAGQGKTVFCISGGGDVLWKSEAGQPLVGAKPVISNGVAYFGDRKGMHAFDTNDGTRIWRDSTDSPATAPAIQGGSVFYGLTSGSVVSTDRKTGERQWGAEFPRFRRKDMVFKGVRKSPTVKGGNVHVMADGGKLYKIGEQ